jgi:hypothetical protein
LVGLAVEVRQYPKRENYHFEGEALLFYLVFFLLWPFVLFVIFLVWYADKDFGIWRAISKFIGDIFYAVGRKVGDIIWFFLGKK